MDHTSRITSTEGTPEEGTPEEGSPETGSPDMDAHSELLAILPPLGRTVLFLDFDGTLVDLAARPDAVLVPRALPDLLLGLHRASGGALALISGRSIADIDGFLPGCPCAVVGSHGAEARAPGLPARHPATGASVLTRMTERLRAWAADRPGTLVEVKPASVVLHYRQAPEVEEAAQAMVSELAAEAPGYVLHRAKMAFELHPADVSKAVSVKALMTRTWPGRIPVAAGDDRTDEGMLAAAQQSGGLGIKIGAGPSCAQHRLEEPAALRVLLTRWMAQSQRMARG